MMPVRLDVALRARDAERARGLDDRAGVLEHVLDRGTELVRVDENDLVDTGPREAERLLAGLPNGDAVGEEADVGERDAPPGCERALHRVGVPRLDTDDLISGRRRFT